MRMRPRQPGSMRARVRGVTLVELSLVIAGALVLAALSTSLWRQAQDKTKLARLITQVTAIDNAVHSQFGQSFSYDGASITSVWNTLPGDVRGAGAPAASLNTPFTGSSVTLTPVAGTVGTSNTRYRVLINTLPTAACIGLLSAVGTEFHSIAVGLTSVKSFTNAAPSASTIVSACTPQSGDPVQIALVNG